MNRSGICYAVACVWTNNKTALETLLDTECMGLEINSDRIVIQRSCWMVLKEHVVQYKYSASSERLHMGCLL